MDFKLQVLREQVSQILIDAILEGSLKQGNQFIEADLQKHFNVSRSPLREAFRELEKKGPGRNHPTQRCFCQNGYHQGYQGKTDGTADPARGRSILAAGQFFTIQTVSDVSLSKFSTLIASVCDIGQPHGNVGKEGDHGQHDQQGNDKGGRRNHTFFEFDAGHFRQHIEYHSHRWR